MAAYIFNPKSSVVYGLSDCSCHQKTGFEVCRKCYEGKECLISLTIEDEQAGECMLNIFVSIESLNLLYKQIGAVVSGFEQQYKEQYYQGHKNSF